MNVAPPPEAPGEITEKTRVPLNVVVVIVSVAISGFAGYSGTLAAINTKADRVEVEKMIDRAIQARAAASDMSYYQKTDGSVLSTKLDALTETVNEIRADVRAIRERR